VPLNAAVQRHHSAHPLLHTHTTRVAALPSSLQFHFELFSLCCNDLPSRCLSLTLSRSSACAGVPLSQALESLALVHSKRGAVGLAVDLRARAADIGRQVYTDAVRIVDLDYALGCEKAKLGLCVMPAHRHNALWRALSF
jgi:hypothetical protein